MKYIFLVHLISNSVMIGVILITQLITYPSFLGIDKNEFVKFHNNYVRNISFVAVPAMTLELLTLVYMNMNINNLILMKSLLVLIVIWLVTFIVIVPIHNNLSKRLEIEKIVSLIRYNWIRTVLWTSKFFIILYIFYEEF